MAGTAAAVTAARNGADVLLVEQGTALGGLGTAGGITSLISWAPAFGGFGLEMYNRLAAEGGAAPYSSHADKPYDGEYMKRVLDGLVGENCADMLLYAKVTDISIDGGRLAGIELCGGEGKFFVTGKYFIDCTGDAALAFMAGEPCEPLGDTQAPTLMCRYTGVNWDEYQKFLARYGGDNVPMIREILPKAVAAGDVRTADFHHPGAFRINNVLTLINVGHVYGADCLSPRGLTEATVEGRRLAAEYLGFYKKYIKGFENAYLVNTACTLGIRETRRLSGRYMLTFEDKAGYKKFDDTVMRFEGGGESDLHASSASEEAYNAYYTLFTSEQPRADDWASLPYRCLLPQRAGNLFVAGRCISAERKVQGRLRTMGNCLMMGQAAGTAAAICLKENIASDKININKLQDTLLRQGVKNK
ncbi:MAG: FAD-dependent oxidoreductase [Defluviitaleaceae bacterium]|nr:FAD-dependent oxidoreductase [Defluviitaleaceae bacterium]